MSSHCLNPSNTPICPSINDFNGFARFGKMFAVPIPLEKRENKRVLIVFLKNV
jgi:hypothetical protein